MSAGGAQFKSREDQRRTRELEEARKAGTIPAERDADGNEINPHIPQYMASAPWYLNQDGPGLGHQRNLKEKRSVATVRDFIPRGQKVAPAATVFRKGACTNCGAMTHKAKDCVERPRKKGAKFSGKDIKADELIVDMAMDYAGKRDHWAQYDGGQHLELLKQHEATAQLRLASEKAAKLALEQQKVAAKEQEREAKRSRKAKARALARKAAGGTSDGGDGGEFSEHSSDSDSDSDSEGESNDEDKMKEDEQVNIGAGVAQNKNQGSAKMTARNLRIREDTAKYLLNLDVNSAYYDPKTRSMRENPLGNNPSEEMYSGDNFVRSSGDARKLADLQLYQFDAFEKGQNLHLNADPTTLEKMNQIFREKKEALKEKKSNTILDKYGGAQHLNAPPPELLFAQTEEYVVYNRAGGVVHGEKAVARSKYKEDEWTHNHTAVWGSYFEKETFRWGYADDHSTAAAPDRAASSSLIASASNAALEQCSLFGIDGGTEASLDEAKVRKAMEQQKRGEAVGEGGKRKYNSMTSDAVDAEAMEAYYRNKSRADDPMANLGS